MSDQDVEIPKNEESDNNALPAAESAPLPPPEEFRKTAYCSHCRRDYLMKTCITKANTLLTETLVLCPRCKKRLKKFRLKDWYDHYIQNQYLAPKGSEIGE